MSSELRRPLLLAAVVLAALVVIVELGVFGLLRGPAGGADLFDARLRATVAEQRPELSPADQDAEVARLGADAARLRDEAPPGMGIPALALIDAIVLVTVLLMGLALVVPDRVHGGTQGVITLVASIVMIVMAVVAIIAATVRLTLMLALLLAPPFGTIAYVARFGFFDRAGATAGLALLLVLKLVTAACLVTAQPRMLQNRGLVYLALTSLGANLLVSLLHGVVPGVLVSITDALAALVVGVIAVVWLLVLLAGAVRSLVKSRRALAVP